MRRHHFGAVPRLLVRLPTLGAVLAGASAPAQDSAVPVYVRITRADASLRVGAPILAPRHAREPAPRGAPGSALTEARYDLTL